MGSPGTEGVGPGMLLRPPMPRIPPQKMIPPGLSAGVETKSSAEIRVTNVAFLCSLGIRPYWQSGLFFRFSSHPYIHMLGPCAPRSHRTWSKQLQWQMVTHSFNKRLLGGRSTCQGQGPRLPLGSSQSGGWGQTDRISGYRHRTWGSGRGGGHPGAAGAADTSWRGP